MKISSIAFVKVAFPSATWEGELATFLIFLSCYQLVDSMTGKNFVVAMTCEILLFRITKVGMSFNDFQHFDFKTHFHL